MDLLEQAWQAQAQLVKNLDGAGTELLVRALEPVFREAGFRQRLRTGVRNILVIEPGGKAHGILLSGFLRELRANHPGAHITLLIRTEVFPLLELCPYVNEIFCLPDDGGLSFASLLELCSTRLWQRRFSLCFCLGRAEDASWSLLLGYMSGARMRAGFKEGSGWDRLLTRAVLNPPELHHLVLQRAFLLQNTGLAVKSKSLEVWYDAGDAAAAWDRLRGFAQGRRIFAVSAAECPAELLQVLMEASDVCFVLLGDAALPVESLLRRLPQERVLDLTGQAGLREQLAVLGVASVYAGGPGWLAQAASALQLPVLYVYAKSVDAGQFPWQTPAALAELSAGDWEAQARRACQSLTGLCYVRTGAEIQHLQQKNS